MKNRVESGGMEEARRICAGIVSGLGTIVGREGAYGCCGEEVEAAEVGLEGEAGPEGAEGGGDGHPVGGRLCWSSARSESYCLGIVVVRNHQNHQGCGILAPEELQYIDH